jgi:hypothetical protein
MRGSVLYAVVVLFAAVVGATPARNKTIPADVRVDQIRKAQQQLQRDEDRLHTIVGISQPSQALIVFLSAVGELPLIIECLHVGGMVSPEISND